MELCNRFHYSLSEDYYEKLEQIQCFVDASFDPLAPPLNQHYQHDHEANPRDYANQRYTVHTLTPSLARIPTTKYIVAFSFNWGPKPNLSETAGAAHLQKHVKSTLTRDCRLFV